jgi:hypothetical protein
VPRNRAYLPDVHCSLTNRAGLFDSLHVCAVRHSRLQTMKFELVSIQRHKASLPSSVVYPLTKFRYSPPRQVSGEKHFTTAVHVSTNEGGAPPCSQPCPRLIQPPFPRSKHATCSQSCCRMDREPPNGAFSTCESAIILLACLWRADDTDADLPSTGTLNAITLPAVHSEDLDFQLRLRAFNLYSSRTLTTPHRPMPA